MQRLIKLKQLILLLGLMMPAIWYGAYGTCSMDGHSNILINEGNVQSSPKGSTIQASIGSVFDPDGYVYNMHNTWKKPQPSSNSNIIEIPITNQPVGSRYLVTWYNSETGYAYAPGVITHVQVSLNGDGEKVVSFSFPSFIRNTQHQTITNTFGDVVFSLILDNYPTKE